MTGHKIKLGKGARIKDCKVVQVAYYANASAAIKARKKPRVRVSRRTTP